MEITWYSKARFSSGIKISSSRNWPVRGFFIPVSFLALVIICTPCINMTKVKSVEALRRKMGTGKREETACSRRRCCPNRPFNVNILSQLWVGYFSCSKLTNWDTFRTDRLGNPISCASVIETVSQSSGYVRTRVSEKNLESRNQICEPVWGQVISQLLPTDPIMSVGLLELRFFSY